MGLMRAAAEWLLGGSVEGRTREMRVKASGGVRSEEDAAAFLEAGASRLGTSGSVGIVREASGVSHGGGSAGGY